MLEIELKDFTSLYERTKKRFEEISPIMGWGITNESTHFNGITLETFSDGTLDISYNFLISPEYDYNAITIHGFELLQPLSYWEEKRVELDKKENEKREKLIAEIQQRQEKKDREMYEMLKKRYES
jgi:hypothetical protein